MAGYHGAWVSPQETVTLVAMTTTQYPCAKDTFSGRCGMTLQQDVQNKKEDI